ncbi:MAG: right-handed parallel beta-helix repeat-containing protein [Thermoplasmata archaeon]|nr:MAG: right-handed parallel beta-helix repeat-containing protein [Thermoplasmata archaeon]
MRLRGVNIGVSLLIILLSLTVLDPPMGPIEKARAGTSVPGGHITSNTTWTALGSPYWIEGNLTIDIGVNLTIEPDSEVRFTGRYSIYIEGFLNAVGTPSNNINITSDSVDPHRGDWNRIQINSTGRAEIEYCQISFGTYGLYMDSCNYVNVSHSKISEIKGNGIFIYNIDHFIIYRNEICNVNHSGIFIDESSNSTVSHNDVWNTGWWAVYVGDTEDNFFEHNDVHDNDNGVYFHRSPNSIVKYNFIIDNNGTGFHNYGSANFRFLENEVSGNVEGIGEIYRSNFAEFKNNIINNNSVGINVFNIGHEAFSQMTGNLINGKDLGEFYYMDQTNLTFSGLYLDSGQNQGYSGYATGQGLLTFYNCSNIVINNSIFSNNNYGIYVRDSNNVQIFSNNFLDGNYGIFSRESPNGLMTNNIFSGNNGGIFLYETTDHVIEDNEITGRVTNWGIGMFRVESTEIRNNIISHSKVGIDIQDTTNCEIDNNLVLDNKEGITLSDSVVNLTSNQLYNNTEFGLSIPWDSMSCISTMTDNVINGYDAEELYYYETEDVVIENRIIDSKSNGYKGNLTEQGVITLYNCRHFEINNNILNNNTYGIYLYRSTCNQIFGNTLKDNYWGGVYLRMNSNFNNITYTTICNSSTGVAITDSRTNNVKHCNVINLRNMGIIFWGAQNNNISFTNISRSDSYGIYAVAGSNVNTVTNCVLFNNSYEGYFVSPGNKVYRNNIIDSDIEFTASTSSVWENYWSDYTGLDDGSGGRTAGDGIGDTDIPHHDLDNYPLMEPLNLRPPTVSSKSPTGIIKKEDVMIQVIFDESMNVTSVEEAFSITDGVSIWNKDYGTFTWSKTQSDNDTMSFTLDFELALNTTYSVQIKHDAKDMEDYLLDGNFDGISENNPIDDYKWSFGTSVGPLLHILIKPTDITCWINDTISFSAFGYDVEWNLNLSWTPEWNVDNDVYGEIDPLTGMFTAKILGTGTVTVCCMENLSVNNFTTFNIVPWPLHHLEIIYFDSTVYEKGQSGNFSVIGWNNENETQKNTTWRALWTSDDDSIIDINEDTGKFTAINYGQTLIKVEDKATGIFSEVEIIVADNIKPVADAGEDLLLTEGTECTFNAEKCSDNNAIEKYEWTIENGISPVTLEGMNPKYLFKNPGTYSVTLNVTDFAGNWAIDEIEITVLPDFDSDGIPDADDPDDDDDDVMDSEDAFPLDPEEWLDTDSDGIGNNADTDDDNDGYLDDEDAFPLDLNEWLDTDFDGIGNNADIDDDNDGIPDYEDFDPLDPTKWKRPTSGGSNPLIYLVILAVIIISVILCVLYFTRNIEYEKLEDEEVEEQRWDDFVFEEEKQFPSQEDEIRKLPPPPPPPPP